MIRTSAGSPRSSRTGIALTVVPIEGPYAIRTLLPVERSNSGANALKAAVNPPEIITRTSAAAAGLASNSAAAKASTSLRKWANRNFIIIPPRDGTLLGVSLMGRHRIAQMGVCHSGRSAPRSDPESRRDVLHVSSGFRVRAFHACPGMTGDHELTYTKS